MAAKYIYRIRHVDEPEPKGTTGTNKNFAMTLARMEAVAGRPTEVWRSEAWTGEWEFVDSFGKES